MDLSKHSVDQAWYSQTSEKLFLPVTAPHSSEEDSGTVWAWICIGAPERYSTCFPFKPDNVKVKLRPHQILIEEFCMWIITCNFKWDSIYKMQNTALYRQGDIMPKIMICHNHYSLRMYWNGLSTVLCIGRIKESCLGY